jgi:signal transduction histidine kinase
MVLAHTLPQPIAHAEFPPRAAVLLAERLLAIGVRAQQRVDESEAAGRRLAFLFKATQELAASPDPATTVDVLVKLVVPDFGDGCTVHVLEQGRRTRKACMARSESMQPWLAESWRLLDQETRPAVARALRSARSEVNSSSRKRRNRSTPRFSYLTVPLRARGRTLGALTVYALDSRPRYAAEDLEVGEALGAQAGLALENAQLHEEQRGIDERVEAVRGQLGAAQGWLLEDERRRIARELHDEVEQTFFAIGLTATAALDGPQRSSAVPPLSQALKQVGQLATVGAEQLRTAIFALNHAEFAGRGLMAAFWSLVRSFQNRTGIETDLVLTGAQRQVPAEVGEVLHAMAREALANVERHSHAGAVVLRLHVAPRSITLTIHDDGAGASQLVLKRIWNSATHFGLRNMRDRVRQLRGTLVAGPGPDGGFLVRARIPL